MKSELRNLNEETKELPFPKLMINEESGKVILAASKGFDILEGVVVIGDNIDCVGYSSNKWLSEAFKDLPEEAEVVLSNKR